MNVDATGPQDERSAAGLLQGLARLDLYLFERALGPDLALVQASPKCLVGGLG